MQAESEDPNWLSRRKDPQSRLISMLTGFGGSVKSPRSGYHRSARDEFTMTKLITLLLPAKIDNLIRGSRIPWIVFTLLAIVSIVRSFIHLLSPDDGAGSIAGMDLSVAGADGIIFAFALWGSSQVLFALVQLAVVVRYRALVPMMYVMLILETLLRELVGKMKPVAFAHTPPGAIGNQLILPLAIVMLGLALWSGFGQANPAQH